MEMKRIATQVERQAPQVTAPSAEEIETIKHKALGRPGAEEFADVIDLLYGTGLRPREAEGLLWADVDFARRVITVRSAMSDHIRFVPIHSKLLEVLRRRRERLPDSRHVLGDHPRAVLDRVTLRFGKLSANSFGRRLPLYSLRRSFALHWMNTGGDWGSLASALGHRSVETTRYLFGTRQQRLETTARSMAAPRG